MDAGTAADDEPEAAAAVMVVGSATALCGSGHSFTAPSAPPDATPFAPMLVTHHTCLPEWPRNVDSSVTSASCLPAVARATRHSLTRQSSPEDARSSGLLVVSPVAAAVVSPPMNAASHTRAPCANHAATLLTSDTGSVQVLCIRSTWSSSSSALLSMVGVAQRRTRRSSETVASHEPHGEGTTRKTAPSWPTRRHSGGRTTFEEEAEEDGVASHAMTSRKAEPPIERNRLLPTRCSAMAYRRGASEHATTPSAALASSVTHRIAFSSVPMPSSSRPPTHSKWRQRTRRGERRAKEGCIAILCCSLSRWQRTSRTPKTSRKLCAMMRMP